MTTKTHKVCGQCGEDKPATEFYRRPEGYLVSACKPCVCSNVRRYNRDGPLPPKPPRTEKKCCKCAVVKPLEDFYSRRSGRSYSSECRECIRSVANVKRNERRSLDRADRASQGVKIRQYGDNALIGKYQITRGEYNALYAAQEGKCFLCSTAGRKRGAPVVDGIGALHIDHDHKTGKIRALLCHNCNVGLGHFMESPELLRSAAKYLECYSQVVTSSEEPCS